MGSSGFSGLNRTVMPVLYTDEISGEDSDCDRVNGRATETAARATIGATLGSYHDDKLEAIGQSIQADSASVIPVQYPVSLVA